MRKYLYCPEGSTNKVARFTGPVSDLWVQLLGKLSVDCIWPEGSTWRSAGPDVTGYEDEC